MEEKKKRKVQKRTLITPGKQLVDKKRNFI